MKVACFLSGSGTNATKIIERSLKPDSAYEVVLLFTDRRKSNVRKISEKFGIPYECEDIKEFFKERNWRDLSLRPEYDQVVLRKIRPYRIDLIACAGYMSIISHPILQAFGDKIINIHPSDLSLEENGSRKFVGVNAVRDAILAGEKELRTTVHVVRKNFDQGEILGISDPVFVNTGTVEEHQLRLKQQCDWIIYPKIIQDIALEYHSSKPKANEVK